MRCSTKSFWLDASFPNACHNKPALPLTVPRTCPTKFHTTCMYDVRPDHGLEPSVPWLGRDGVPEPPGFADRAELSSGRLDINRRDAPLFFDRPFRLAVQPRDCGLQLLMPMTSTICRPVGVAGRNRIGYIHGMGMIQRIKHKRLRRLHERGDESGFNPHDGRKLRRILHQLSNAVEPEEMNVPGFHFHRLRGDRSDAYAVTVRANWRVTWRVADDGTYIDVDYEDYH